MVQKSGYCIYWKISPYAVFYLHVETRHPIILDGYLLVWTGLGGAGNSGKHFSMGAYWIGAYFRS